MNYNFITTSFQTIVPLHYDIVYYMESPDNEELNNVMRQLQEDGPLFMNTEMFPFPIKLQYVSQRELDGDYLRSQLGDAYDAEDVNEVIENMRECLSADNGGGLTARCIPSFTRDDMMKDDYAVCYCPDFGLLSAEDAFEKAKSFARYVAEENFKRLTNVSYDTYQRAKEDAWRPRRSSGGFEMMELVLRLPDPKKITRDMQRRLLELDTVINQLTGNDEDSAIELLTACLMKKMNKGKLKKKCKIIIEKNKIYLEFSETKRKEVDFEKSARAKTLYIFFLRLIERNEKNPKYAKYVSYAGLSNYKNELKSIYGRISNRKDIENNIKYLCEDSEVFTTCITRIRRFFWQEFGNDYKRYSIEFMDYPKQNGNPIYGINLTTKDFILDEYSIEKM